MPKDPVKSMQTYARLLDNGLEMIDWVLARVPDEGATPKTVRDDLEKAKATAKAKFERMDTNYKILSVSDELTEDMKTKDPFILDQDR